MELLASLNTAIQHPAWDSVVILFFFVAAFILGSMSGGRAKLLTFLLGTYIALFVSPLLFRYLDSYKIGTHPYRNIFTFFGFLVLIIAILSKKVFGGGPSYRWPQALVMSFLAVGLFVAGSLNILAFPGTLEFSTLTRTFFAGKSAYLLWAVAPLIGLLILPRGK